MGKKDLDDPDREAIPEQHFTYYYNRYFKKQLNTRFFGTNSLPELFNLVQDTVEIANGYCVSKLKESDTADFSIFVKLAEESRRERQRRLDAGDDTAKLRFSVLAASTPQSNSPSGTAAAKAWQSNPKLSPTGAAKARPATKWQPRQSDWN